MEQNGEWNLKIPQFIITRHPKVSFSMLLIKKSAMTTTTTSKNDGNMEPFLGREAKDLARSFSFSSSTPFCLVIFIITLTRWGKIEWKMWINLLEEEENFHFLDLLVRMIRDGKRGKWWKKKIGFRDSFETRRWGEKMRENLFQSTPTTAC